MMKTTEITLCVLLLEAAFVFPGKAQTIPSNVLYSTGTATAGTYASEFQTTNGSVTIPGSSPYYIENTVAPGSPSIFLYDPGASSTPSGTFKQSSLANPSASLITLSAGGTILISVDFLAASTASNTQTYAGIGFVNPNANAATGDQSGILSFLNTTNNGTTADALLMKGVQTSNVLTYGTSGTVGSANTTFTSSANNTQWLRLQVTITVSSDAVFTAGSLAGTVTVTDTLYKISSDGAATGTSVGSYSNTFSIASGASVGSTASLDLTGGQIALYLQAYNSATSGSEIIDNFAVSAVPEPRGAFLIVTPLFLCLFSRLFRKAVGRAPGQMAPAIGRE